MDGELNPFTSTLCNPSSKHLEKLMSEIQVRKCITPSKFSYHVHYLIIRTLRTPSMAFNFSTTSSVTDESTSISEYA